MQFLNNPHTYTQCVLFDKYCSSMGRPELILRVSEPWKYLPRSEVEGSAHAELFELQQAGVAERLASRTLSKVAWDSRRQVFLKFRCDPNTWEQTHISRTNQKVTTQLELNIYREPQ